jgi:hypothetical protein
MRVAKISSRGQKEAEKPSAINLQLYFRARKPLSMQAFWRLAGDFSKLASALLKTVCR